MFTLTTLLVRNGYLAENKVLPKKSELGLCKLKLYVVIFHTQISMRIDQECLYRISWKLVELQHIFCFYYVPSFRRWGHSNLPSVRQEWFTCNNIKTPQYNHFKITCLEMLLRASHTDQVRISLCGVFCIFRFLLWCQTYILSPYLSQAGHSFHSYFFHIILVIKLFFYDCVDFRV
jgi:hypothetical protein